jgi:hypothetical protein
MSSDKSKSNMNDIKYIEEAEETEPASADREAEEKALVRKIDISLLPCIWIMYLLSYMDVRPDPPARAFSIRLTICVADQCWQRQSCWYD